MEKSVRIEIPHKEVAIVDFIKIIKEERKRETNTGEVD